MFRFLICLILCFLYSSNLNAHLGHNDNLKKIEFDIYRNNEKVGYHKVAFSNKKIIKEVNTDIFIDVKILGISFHKYHSLAKEVYINNKLVEFKSTTKDGSDNDYCNIKLDKDEYSFDGTTEGKIFKYSSKKNFIIGTWWNHDVLQNNNFVAGQSCRPLETKIIFLKKENKLINGQNEVVQYFNVKGENLDLRVGYVENKKQWISMDFSLKGEWQYKLKALE
jgi:hypothetical protein